MVQRIKEETPEQPVRIETGIGPVSAGRQPRKGLTSPARTDPSRGGVEYVGTDLSPRPIYAPSPRLCEVVKLVRIIWAARVTDFGRDFLEYHDGLPTL